MDKDLVVVQNNQVVTSSLQVAKDFGKEHNHVLRDIREIMEKIGSPKLDSENSAANLFYEDTYENRGKQYPMFYMNRDGFSLLVMGFTGSDALHWKLKYIGRFNAMEKALQEQVVTPYKLPQTYAEALRELADKHEALQLAEAKNKQQEQIIGELKPKVDYMDTILQNPDVVPITAIAKDYGMSGQEMNKLLHKFHVIYKVGKQWLLYSEHQAKGYTHSKTDTYRHKDGSVAGIYMNTQWTQKGRLFLYNLLKKHDVFPLIEQLALPQ